MPAPLRIARPPNATDRAVNVPPTSGNNASELAQDYVARLVRLIPAEIVALYLAGRGLILGYGGERASSAGVWSAWTAFCFGCLVLTRIAGTRDIRRKIPAEWPAIVIAAISFGLWVYSLGDVFNIALKIWDPLLAGLLVLGWTFVTPFIYNPNK